MNAMSDCVYVIRAMSYYQGRSKVIGVHRRRSVAERVAHHLRNTKQTEYGHPRDLYTNVSVVPIRSDAEVSYR